MQTFSLWSARKSALQGPDGPCTCGRTSCTYVGAGSCHAWPAHALPWSVHLVRCHRKSCSDAQRFWCALLREPVALEHREMIPHTRYTHDHPGLGRWRTPLSHEFAGDASGCPACGSSCRMWGRRTGHTWSLRLNSPRRRHRLHLQNRVPLLRVWAASARHVCADPKTLPRNFYTRTGRRLNQQTFPLPLV